MNVEGCRIGTNKSIPASPAKANDSIGTFKTKDRHTHSSGFDASVGRWPANFIHDGSTEATDLLGDAARFFYTAKTSKAERGDDNHHPTVKPIDLMRYLCRLVTPPDGLVLDPFTGSGSTGCAAMLEGFRFHGIEREPEYVAIATARIAHWARQADAVQVALPL